MDATERDVYRRQVSADVLVSGHVGYGRSVSMEISAGSLTVNVDLDPGRDREIAVALMEAATSAETAPAPTTK